MFCTLQLWFIGEGWKFARIQAIPYFHTFSCTVFSHIFWPKFCCYFSECKDFLLCTKYVKEFFSFTARVLAMNISLHIEVLPFFLDIPCGILEKQHAWSWGTYICRLKDFTFSLTHPHMYFEMAQSLIWLVYILFWEKSKTCSFCFPQTPPQMPGQHVCILLSLHFKSRLISVLI